MHEHVPRQACDEAMRGRAWTQGQLQPAYSNKCVVRFMLPPVRGNPRHCVRGSQECAPGVV